MEGKIPLVLQILREACQNNGYSFTVVDDHCNNLVEVSDGEGAFFSSNSIVGTYPINSGFACQLVRDKAWTYEVLRRKGYRIPEGMHFYLKEQFLEYRSGGRELDDAFPYAEGLGYPVFVKPNAHFSRFCASKINDGEELSAHLQEIVRHDSVAIVQEFLDLPEYRIFVLDGEVQFMYRKEQPDRSPSSEEASEGVRVRDYTEEVSGKVADWVRRITDDFKIRVCGIDLFVDGSPDNPDDFVVIELNSSPNLGRVYKLGKRQKALDIWQRVLDSYFSR